MANSNESGIGMQYQSDGGGGGESGLNTKWVDLTETSDNKTAEL
jgi:hypothetical protein